METLQKVKLKLRVVSPEEEERKTPISLQYLKLALKRENEKENRLHRALRLAIHIKKNVSLFFYLEPLLKALSLRDRTTGEHSWKVAVYSILIADTLGIDEELTTNIYVGALFHDIGKIGIPDAILLKKGKIDLLERETIKNHPVYGYEILKNFNLPIVKNILLKHHERIDGKGYPLGVNHREIPFYVNIVSICDVFDALTERRPYRDPMPLEKVLSILEEESGKAFYPEIVEVAVSTFSNVGKVDFWTVEKILYELEGMDGKKGSNPSGRAWNEILASNKSST
jgi:putative two-component system response regulator